MLFSTLLAILPFAAAVPLTKRQTFGGRATFYDVGLGACGGYNSAGDYIVALNSAQYGGGYPGPNCGRSLTISYGGKTAVATVRDECPTCGYGDLDLSRGLFNNFANEGMGTFQMQWWWNDGSSNNQPAAQQASTTPSPTPTQAPTTAYTPPASSSSSTRSPSAPAPSSADPAPAASSASSASTAASVSSPGSSSFNSSATVSAPDVVATNITAPAGANGQAVMGNLAMINQAVANMGRVIVVAATTK